MASFGQYPPLPLSQNQPLPPPLQEVPQQPGNQYSANWGYGGGEGSVVPHQFTPVASQNYHQVQPNSTFHHVGYAPQQPMHHQEEYQPQQPQQYSSYPPPLPPPDSSYPPPPPPPPLGPVPPIYYPSSQYNQYIHQPLQSPLPPPPPSSPPPSSSIPPPPPSSPPPSSSSMPPVSKSKEIGMNGRSRHKNDQERRKELSVSGKRESGNLNQGHTSNGQKPPLPKFNGPSGRVELEEEKKLRKKREMEKHKQEEKHRQLKESQNNVLHKTQMLSSGLKGHGSILGSRMGERTSSTPLLSGERTENRFKKPTTFLCRMKFRNELPEPSSQPKLMSVSKDRERYAKYTITSLEKMYKPELYVEGDLGIPLDLLDLSVYNPPKQVPPLAPEDEEMVRDDEALTSVKNDGIRRKERPTDQGVSWLVKTQYISPLSNDAAKQSFTEKQAKEMREKRGGGNNLDNNRERKIQQIEASFEACKSRPVHATNKKLVPTEVMPLFPDFDRFEDQFVIATFDGAPTADSELFGKLDSSTRDEHESRAVMKSFSTRGSDQGAPDKFLAYMVPSLDELSKDMHDESEDISYSWIREYQWDVRGEDMNDPTTYIVSFDDGVARYAPLPTKLVLRKKRSKEARSATDDAEHFPVPATVTVRKRSAVSAIELNDVSSMGAGNSSRSRREGFDYEDGIRRSNKVARHTADMDQSSGTEDNLSE